MATTNIELDIENITGVSDADDQFIISAQKFVVSSVPNILLKWATSVTVPGSHGGDSSPTAITIPVGTDHVISVTRNGYEARETASEDRAFISDSNSLKLATSTFPKYWKDSGNKIQVKPDPSDSATAIVEYVDFSNLDDDCDLRNAVIYHAASSEFTKLAATNLNNAKETADNPPVPPEIEDVPDFTFSISTSLPTYVSPTVGGANESLTTSMTALTSDAAATDGDFLDYSKWFTVAGELIEDEEDTELANAQLSKINTYLQSYSQALQDQTNQFNTQLQAYQAELSKEMQEAQYEQQAEYSTKLQKYQAEIQEYSAEINEITTIVSNYIAVSQGYQQNAEKYYTWAQQEIQSYIQNNTKTMALQQSQQR